MTITAFDNEFTARAPAEGQVTGASFAVGFDLRFLRMIAGKTGAIRIETSGAGDPAIVLTDDPDVRFVLMPMRI